MSSSCRRMRNEGQSCWAKRWEERKLALEEERLVNERKAKERVIMFMNPTTMGDTSKKFCELTRGEILTEKVVSL